MTAFAHVIVKFWRNRCDFIARVELRFANRSDFWAVRAMGDKVVTGSDLIAAISIAAIKSLRVTMAIGWITYL